MVSTSCGPKWAELGASLLVCGARTALPAPCTARFGSPLAEARTVTPCSCPISLSSHRRGSLACRRHAVFVDVRPALQPRAESLEADRRGPAPGFGPVASSRSTSMPAADYKRIDAISGPQSLVIADAAQSSREPRGRSRPSQRTRDRFYPSKPLAVTAAGALPTRPARRGPRAAQARQDPDSRHRACRANSPSILSRPPPPRSFVCFPRRSGRAGRRSLNEPFSASKFPTAGGASSVLRVHDRHRAARTSCKKKGLPQFRVPRDPLARP